jgi:hypothetical protein
MGNLLLSTTSDPSPRMRPTMRMAAGRESKHIGIIGFNEHIRIEALRLDGQMGDALHCFFR